MTAGRKNKTWEDRHGKKWQEKKQLGMYHNMTHPLSVLNMCNQWELNWHWRLLSHSPTIKLNGISQQETPEGYECTIDMPRSSTVLAYLWSAPGLPLRQQPSPPQFGNYVQNRELSQRWLRPASSWPCGRTGHETEASRLRGLTAGHRHWDERPSSEAAHRLDRVQYLSSPGRCPPHFQMGRFWPCEAPDGL